MTTMHDAILDVVRGSGTADDKIKIIGTLISDENRWTSLYIIWGLIAVVILTIVTLIVFLFLLDKAVLKVGDFPQGIIAFGATALGALAAYLVPPSHASAPLAATMAPAALAPAASAPMAPAAATLAPPALAPAVLAPVASGPASSAMR